MAEKLPDIALLQAYDDGEWLSLEREYSGRLLAYIAKRIKDTQAREDVLQETMLGAVRGIATYDPIYSFEQYLFGICHNRTIDHMRRRKLSTLDYEEGESARFGIEARARNEETPSRIVRGMDLESAARGMLSQILRAWVQETWAEGEFTRLMVIEALLHGGWRNKDTWQRFGLRDETTVAGIKFRAIARLRELALERDASGKLLEAIAQGAQSGEANLDFSLESAWRDARVSCPARHWLARSLVHSLEPGPQEYVRFHIEEMRCPWCAANLEDLRALESASDIAAMVERVQASTLRYLRSRTRE
ncbi:MAG TPA: sigma-70 family RNA polymerase sigma factor [Planctomycetota bacterium]|nr:sigma-70 family RNA polymerase sigma factor [Planctomycetota bacterium]